MNTSYFNQFNITKVFYIRIRESIIRIRNLTIILLLILIIGINFQKRIKLIRNRTFLINKISYLTAYNLTKEHLNTKHLTYLPLIYNLLTLLILINLIGLFPYVLTITSHIIITFSLSLTILLRRTIKRTYVHKRRFISTLTPQGCPLLLAPFLILIETTRYFTRAISLGVRLAANISAGHLLLAILSRFSFNILLSKFFFIRIFPLAILGFIILLEIIVAFIQAYVFTLLTTIYLSDSIKLH